MKNSLKGASRIALGTVQFGMDYGINESGKVQLEEVRKILSYARGHQIDTLDTAIAYGDSERVLGEAGVSGCKIVSKLPMIPKKCKNIEEWVKSSVCGSLERLKVTGLYGLLLHCPGDLFGKFGQKLYSGLRICKDQAQSVKLEFPFTLSEPGCHATV